MKYIRIFGFMGLLIGLMVVAAGCTSTPQASETDPESPEVSVTVPDSPEASGTEPVSPEASVTEPEPSEQLGGIWVITEIHKGGEKGTVGQIFLQSDSGCTAIVTITDETHIWQSDMGALTEVSINLLGVGDTIQTIMVTGPVVGSAPAQATAIEIMLPCATCGV
jgi:hypothetical protein